MAVTAERELVDALRQMRRAADRFRTRTERLDREREQVVHDRDEAIREAIASDVPRAVIAEAFGLTEGRIYQIRRHSR